MRNFKIPTVILIFLVFVFRLLFANVSLLNSFKASQTGKATASHSSHHIKKRRRNTETVITSNIEIYSDIEVCEENPDEKDLMKVNPPELSSFVHFLFKRIISSPESNQAFGSVSYNLYPKRYLAFSILRI